MQKSVTVKVPATTANMGPGFDCLGMALDIWNSIHVEFGHSGMEIEGEGADSLPRDDQNLVFACFSKVFEEMGRPVPQVKMVCHNAIPLGRGLGSSAAAVVGGLAAANHICGGELSTERLLELAVEIEGHPDNVTAAMLGGCTIVVKGECGLVTADVPFPDEISAVLFIPDQPMPTDEARGLLDDQVSREDAVYNIGRTALLVRALATGDLSQLAIATEDRLHQPARQSIFFPMKNIFRAALSAGALGVFLSGAGSSVLAFARDREFTIGYEMADAASKSGVEGIIKVTKPSRLGVHVVEDGHGADGATA
ncbi:MAG: homoserine kinase [Chloroflexi bacterium]|nr:homoserine kinase [Chloroflexota bacterium]